MQHRPATITGEKTPGPLAPRRYAALMVDLVTLGSETVVSNAAVVTRGGRWRGYAIPCGVADGRS